jgi:hypothetical protein
MDQLLILLGVLQLLQVKTAAEQFIMQAVDQVRFILLAELLARQDLVAAVKVQAVQQIQLGEL